MCTTTMLFIERNCYFIIVTIETSYVGLSIYFLSNFKIPLYVSFCICLPFVYTFYSSFIYLLIILLNSIFSFMWYKYNLNSDLKHKKNLYSVDWFVITAHIYFLFRYQFEVRLCSHYIINLY